MAPRTARIVPIRRKDFNVQGFLAFIAANGAEVGTPTNPYEVVRYRAYWRGTSTTSVHIVYAKDNGLLTWTGGSLGHYRAFLDGAPMEELPGSRQSEGSQSKPQEQRLPKPKPRKRTASRSALLARDGDECWFCGEPMGADCTIEHLVPKSKGGANSLANYALAHQRCNADAANKPLVEKIAMRAKLRKETA